MGQWREGGLGDPWVEQWGEGGLGDPWVEQWGGSRRPLSYISVTTNHRFHPRWELPIPAHRSPTHTSSTGSQGLRHLLSMKLPSLSPLSTDMPPTWQLLASPVVSSKAT